MRRLREWWEDFCDEWGATLLYLMGGVMIVVIIFMTVREARADDICRAEGAIEALDRLDESGGTAITRKCMGLPSERVVFLCMLDAYADALKAEQDRAQAVLDKERVGI